MNDEDNEITPERLAAVDAEYQSRCPTEFDTFIKGLIIPSATGPQPFSECIADHQQVCFDDIGPSLVASRDGRMPEKRWHWWERTKKASKDADIGICLLWLLAFPTRPYYGQIGAADRDQAGIVKRRINGLLHENKWLNDFIEVQNYKVKHKGGMAELDILAADVAGSHGETPDILVLNEASHITKWEFILNLLDNAGGVPQGIVLVATNAGFKGTKVEKMRNEAIQNKKWTSHVYAQPAPWIGVDDLEEAASRNTPSRYKRLWHGQWASSKGDALKDADIDRIFRVDLRPLTKPEPGYRYIGGLDLGVSHDHSGLIILGVNTEKRLLRVGVIKGYEPLEATKQVDLIAVQADVLALSRTFRCEWFGFDPYEARLMAQQLKTAGVLMKEVGFVGNSLVEMATTMKQVVEGGILQSYEDHEGRLRRDLGKMSIVEKSYGYKLESVRDEHGHADVGTALAIVLPKAVEMLNAPYGLQPGDDLTVDDLTPDEEKKILEEMHPDLLDMMDTETKAQHDGDSNRKRRRRR